MTLAFLNLSWFALTNGLELGGIYALMAVGIGLVFGVLRLVNFAYGQLIMAGGFALAFGQQWGLPNWLSILFCFGVVLVLSLLMDRVVFRPLRGHSPAVMLVTTFAVAFILQNVALLAFGSYGKTASAFAYLNAPVVHRRRRDPEDLDHRDRDRRRLPRSPPAAPDPDTARPAHARRLDGLQDGSAPRHPRQPGHRRRGRHLGAVCGDRGRLAECRAVPDHEHVRPVRRRSSCSQASWSAG